MIKKQKLIDVWEASDGSEHLTEWACTIHEEKLLEVKGLTEQQERNRQTDLENQRRVEEQRQWDRDHPEEAAARDETIREQNRLNMLKGIEWEWWESVDAKGNPVPWPEVFVLSTREIRQFIWKSASNINLNGWKTIGVLEERENTMAHLLARLGVFDSISDAKRNGWDKPIVEGEFWLQKRTKRVMVVDD